MVPFSCSVLLGLLAGLHRLLDPWSGIAFAAAALGLSRAAPSTGRPARIAAGAAILLGFASDRPRTVPPSPEPRAIPVRIEGEVSGPSRQTRRGVLIPVAGQPPLLVPGEFPGPLPGSRIRASGRWEAHGRFIAVPCLSLIEAEPPAGISLRAMTEQLRRDIRDRLAWNIEPAASGVLRALLLGDRSLSPDDREKLARTGTMHFFAVSGLHLALLVLMAERLLGRRTVWAVPAAVFYAGLTGLRTPVGRALCLATLSVAGFHRFRPPAPGSHLLIAAVLLAVLHPAELADAGFLLSFSACAGILCIASPMLRSLRDDPAERWFRRERGQGATGRLRDAFLVSLAATFATAPVSMHFFGRFTPAAIPGSVILAPLMPPLLATAMLKVLLPDNPLPIFLAESLHQSMAFLCDLVDRIPLGHRLVPRPSWTALASWAAAALLSAGAARGGKLRAAVAIQLLGLAALLLPGGEPRHRTILLDAGRGTAIYMAGDGKGLLLDTGPASARVAEQLQELGVRSLAGIYLTHEHEDHIGGLDGVLDAYPESPVFAPFGDRFHPAWRGNRRDDGCTILWPRRSHGIANPNDRSLAALCQSRQGRMLATGDLEGRGLGDLLREGDDLDADLLILPHHGARQPFLATLVLRSQPCKAWIPARAGFPSDDLMVLSWADVPAETSWTGTADPWPPRPCASSRGQADSHSRGQRIPP